MIAARWNCEHSNEHYAIVPFIRHNVVGRVFLQCGLLIRADGQVYRTKYQRWEKKKNCLLFSFLLVYLFLLYGFHRRVKKIWNRQHFGAILSMSPRIQQQMKNKNYHNNCHLKFILTHYIHEFGQNPLLFMTMTNIGSSVNRNTPYLNASIQWKRHIALCVRRSVRSVGTQFKFRLVQLQIHLKIITLWHNLHNNFIQLKYHNYRAQTLEFIHSVCTVHMLHKIKVLFYAFFCAKWTTVRTVLFCIFCLAS